MKYIARFNEKISIPVFDQTSKKLLPQTLSIETSNGKFTLELTDYVVNLPKIYTSYHHSTPDESGDVLSDGEPDYLCIDFNFFKVDDDLVINVEITYGDAMMFEFKIKKWNDVDVFVYNGQHSKFDPDYKFTFTEESIEEIIKFFNRFGFRLTRDRFNFLDSDITSYDTTKNGGHAPTINHPG
jgi:hypothetical protein